MDGSSLENAFLAVSIGKDFLHLHRNRILHGLWHCHGVRLYADRLKEPFGVPFVFLVLFPCAVFTIVAGVFYSYGIVFMFEIQQHFVFN